jgi:hypothetical protein
LSEHEDSNGPHDTSGDAEEQAPVGTLESSDAKPAGVREKQLAKIGEAVKSDPALRPLFDLAERCLDDPAVLLEDDALETITTLKSMRPATYGRLRNLLKTLRISVAELDRQVNARSAERRREAKHERTKAKSAAGPASRQSVDSGEDEKAYVPRLVLNDVTIERAAMIAEAQRRGLFVLRDELSGLIGNTSRYAKGGSDRSFWLEGYMGRPYVVERVTRSANSIDRLTIGILGAIQPDKLHSLLIKADDDGMLARFMPFWPNSLPPSRPKRAIKTSWADRAFDRLYSILLPATGPVLVDFDEPARNCLDDFRTWAHQCESQEAGLMVSFIGKTPGFVIRLSLILAYLDWAASDASEPPTVISEEYVARAVRFVQTYALPMAKRTYAEASVPTEVRGAQQLADLIVREKISQLTIRDVARRERQGLKTTLEVEAALDVLIQGGWVTHESKRPGRQGGRGQQIYRVAARVHELAKEVA